MQPPISYTPDIETPTEDEVETIRGLEDALRQIFETTAENSGHAVRAVHAKSHGLIEAELEVLPDLPPELAQGLFAAAGRYPAVLRISTNPGDVLPDTVSVPRGIALKVMGVEGERLPGADQGASQDFILVNGPVFAAKGPAEFLKNLKLLAKTTDRATWAKEALSKVLRGTEKALEAVGGESSTLKTLGGAPNVHPLGETYFSQVPFRYGAYVAKLQLVPVSEPLTRHTGFEIDAGEDPDAVRHAVDVAMQAGEGIWELRVQLCRDLDKMPIEDASALWEEELSPFQTVAHLRARPQRGWSEARSEVVDETLRFSVWTGLAAHRPLGAVNRARKPTYDLSAEFRQTFNRCPIHEPQSVNLSEDRRS